VQYDETYCVISLDIVRNTRYTLIITVGLLLYAAIEFASGSKYQDWFESEAFKRCEPSSWKIFYNWSNLLWQITLQGKNLISNVLLI